MAVQRVDADGNMRQAISQNQRVKLFAFIEAANKARQINQLSATAHQ